MVNDEQAAQALAGIVQEHADHWQKLVKEYQQAHHQYPSQASGRRAQEAVRCADGWKEALELLKDDGAAREMAGNLGRFIDEARKKGNLGNEDSFDKPRLHLSAAMWIAALLTEGVSLPRGTIPAARIKHQGLEIIVQVRPGNEHDRVEVGTWQAEPTWITPGQFTYEQAQLYRKLRASGVDAKLASQTVEDTLTSRAARKGRSW